MHDAILSAGDFSLKLPLRMSASGGRKNGKRQRDMPPESKHFVPPQLVSRDRLSSFRIKARGASSARKTHFEVLKRLDSKEGFARKSRKPPKLFLEFIRPTNDAALLQTRWQAT
jgi:hypothetical protein